MSVHHLKTKRDDAIVAFKLEPDETGLRLSAMESGAKYHGKTHVGTMSGSVVAQPKPLRNGALAATR